MEWNEGMYPRCPGEIAVIHKTETSLGWFPLLMKFDSLWSRENLRVDSCSQGFLVQLSHVNWPIEEHLSTNQNSDHGVDLFGLSENRLPQNHPKSNVFFSSYSPLFSSYLGVYPIFRHPYLLYSIDKFRQGKPRGGTSPPKLSSKHASESTNKHG